MNLTVLLSPREALFVMAADAAFASSNRICSPLPRLLYLLLYVPLGLLLMLLFGLLYLVTWAAVALGLLWGAFMLCMWALHVFLAPVG